VSRRRWTRQYFRMQVCNITLLSDCCIMSSGEVRLSSRSTVWWFIAQDFVFREMSLESTGKENGWRGVSGQRTVSSCCVSPQLNLLHTLGAKQANCIRLLECLRLSVFIRSERQLCRNGLGNPISKLARPQPRSSLTELVRRTLCRQLYGIEVLSSSSAPAYG
jgi:hypothetical protein